MACGPKAVLRECPPVRNRPIDERSGVISNIEAHLVQEAEHYADDPATQTLPAMVSGYFDLLDGDGPHPATRSSCDPVFEAPARLDR